MKTKVYEGDKNFNAYSNFTGINVMRPDITLETGENQALIELHNAHVDSYGQIRNDPPASVLIDNNYPIRHVRYYSTDSLCWIEKRGDGLWFNSDNSVQSTVPLYKTDTPISSCLFNKRVQIFSSSQEAYTYDGNKIYRNQSNQLNELRPSFGVAVQRRLAVAGFKGQDTLVLLSRVDDETVFYGDESKESATNTLSADFINITNLLTKADRITGLAAFEQQKLAIFTTSRIFIFQIGVNLENTGIDDKVNINVGTISHNSIARVGDDLLFCSNHGVHSLKRSRQNGLTVDTQLLSQNIKDLYLDLLSQVDDKSHITAVFDELSAQYHIYFPINDTRVERLTLTIPTQAEDEVMRWSTGDFLDVRCGDTSNGELVVGTSGGIFKIHSTYRDGEVFPTFKIQSPLLWLGSMQDTKTVTDMLIQFSGPVRANCTIEDEKGNKLINFNLESNQFMEKQFPVKDLLTDFQHRIRAKVQGVRLIIEGSSTGRVLLTGFAFTKGKV